jgi:aminoglycoside 2'-N-acetyltransferase I
MMRRMTNAARVKVVRTHELTQRDRESVVSVCIAAHEVDDFENLFAFIPSGGRHALAYVGGDLVAHAVATTRWAQPGGHRILRTAYIDAVSTHPRHQGRGYGSATMRVLAGSIGDYEIACLQTDKPAFYERLGWERWRGPLAGRDGDRIIATPEQQGVMVLRLPRTPPLDLDAGLSIERQPSRIWE